MSKSGARATDLLDETYSLQASIERLRHALRVQQRQFEVWERLVNPRADRQVASERLVHLRRTGTL